jgi:hypothetical protein
VEEDMQNLMPDQSTVTWRATLRRASRDAGDLVHDVGWLAGWVTVRLGAAVIEGQALLALRRRLGLPA